MKNILIMLLLVFPGVVFSESFSGKCVGVSDGDTIKVMRDGQAVRIRFEGIDCPESSMPFGQRAKQFTSKQCFGKVVTIQVKDIDRYGRFVGRVFVGDTDVNYELVKAGLAWHYRYYSSEKALADAEEYARKNGLGLWQDPDPTPPWEWRKAEREKKTQAHISKMTELMNAYYKSLSEFDFESLKQMCSYDFQLVEGSGVYDLDTYIGFLLPDKGKMTVNVELSELSIKQDGYTSWLTYIKDTRIIQGERDIRLKARESAVFTSRNNEWALRMIHTSSVKE